MGLLGRYWWWPVVLVLVHFGMNGCFGCWEQERIALLQFEASIVNYVDEYYFPHWNLGKKESDCCEWERVKCNITTGRVIQLTINSTMSYSSRESGGGWYFNASLFLKYDIPAHTLAKHASSIADFVAWIEEDPCCIMQALIHDVPSISHMQ